MASVSLSSDVALSTDAAPSKKNNRKSRRAAGVLALLQKARTEPNLVEDAEEPVASLSAADLGLDSVPSVIAPVSTSDEGDEVGTVEPHSRPSRFEVVESVEPSPVLEAAVESTQPSVAVLDAVLEPSQPIKARRFQLSAPAFLPVMVGNVRHRIRQTGLMLSRVDWVALGTAATVPTMFGLVYLFGAVNALSLILSAVAVVTTLYVVVAELFSVCLFGKRAQLLRCVFSVTLLGLVWATLAIADGFAHQLLVASLLAALIAPRLIKNW